MPQLIDTARIGNETTLRFTPDGTPVMNLSLPCDYGRKDQSTGKKPTQWVDASIWGKQAEALAPYLVKGQWVAFTLDDVHIEEFNKGNEVKSKLVGRVSNIKLVGGAPANQAPQPAQTARAPANPVSQPGPSNFDNFDDDIPFS